MAIVVEEMIVLELEVVQAPLSVRETQLTTYRRMAHFKLGLLINFEAELMRDGSIMCKMNGYLS
jgi:GxxExxY protein